MRGLAEELPDRHEAQPARPRSLDAIDLRLLELLGKNARSSQEELASTMSLSRPAVRERMRRLERMGVLERYTIEVDWTQLGYPLLAYVSIRTSGGTCGAHAERVMALSTPPAVIEECHRITGEWCLLVKVRARSSNDLEVLLDKIRELPRVFATSTTLALSTLRQDQRQQHESTPTKNAG
jgi:Lrp/AsnC family transcriptional regulator, leucine-responsive regulatory protein